MCQWYVQMIYYHDVYVPLLLRLSNDVEENPGPRSINDIVDPTYPVHADFNQGNELMFGMNAGKQCVAMSLYAIVYKEIKSVNTWDRMMLNSILLCGNSLYGIIRQNTNKTYLLLTDVPEYVDIENRVFNLQYSEAFSGTLHMSEVSLPYVTLEHALNEVFLSLHYNSCLLTIGMNIVAIMMPFPGVLKVFDSHSRDIFGRPSAMDCCVLISVEGIANLGEYFRLTSRSTVVIPFELKGVMCIDNDDTETELCARVITNSGMVDLPEVFKQCDVNSKTLSNANFDQASKRKIMSNDSTEQSESRATSSKSREHRKTKRTRRQYESTEQREARLAKMRKYNNSNKAKRQNKTTEEREARLAKLGNIISPEKQKDKMRPLRKGKPDLQK